MDINISIYAEGELRGSKQISTPCTIGRSKEATLSIGHKVMSRKHCELYELAGKLFLRDCGSLNGTLWKGKYIEDPVALAAGDEFVIGELVFRISLPTGPLTEAQKAIAERPTATFATIGNTDDSSHLMLKTVMEMPKKISPDSVRVVR
ncbi:MAG: FHA domain-containing protein [Planctomycetaceae bacterium]|nr:FHA domain-containing protein [Planctomycetaceae bacterium]